MLCLERAKSQDLVIQIRSRDPVFSHPFRLALAIALLLHVGAFFLFYIHPFNLGSSFIFPPVIVRSDDSLLSPNVQILSLKEERSWQEDILPSLATLQEGPVFPLRMEIASFLPTNWQIASSEVQHLPSPLLSALKPIQIYMSGEIVPYALSTNDILQHDTVPSAWLKPPLSTYEVRYLVQVDEQSGEIFWYDRRQSSGYAAIDQLTENLLLQLKFLPSHFYPLVGEVIFSMNLNIENL